MPVDAVPASIAAMPNLHAGETAALTLAMQLQAKRSGLLSAIRPVLDDLEKQAGFWLAPALVEAALKKLGEA